MIDTHAHLNDPEFDNDLAEVIARAQEAGVERIVTCGYDLASSRLAVEIALRFDCVLAAVGVHPHDAKSFDEAILKAIEELASSPRVLAIGETGLDYHYDFSPRRDQIAAFEAHIALACRLDLPLVVHSRKSGPETLQVLRANAANSVRCVFHCFSGDADFAREVFDCGFYIGVDGPVTFKASEKLREVVRAGPRERLLIETDCPYLAPVPHRGKRNEPAYVHFVAQEVASIWGTGMEDVDRITTDNARAFFGSTLNA